MNKTSPSQEWVQLSHNPRVYKGHPGHSANRSLSMNCESKGGSPDPAPGLSEVMVQRVQTLEGTQSFLGFAEACGAPARPPTASRLWDMTATSLLKWPGVEL